MVMAEQLAAEPSMTVEALEVAAQALVLGPLVVVAQEEEQVQAEAVAQQAEQLALAEPSLEVAVVVEMVTVARQATAEPSEVAVQALVLVPLAGEP